MIDLIPPSLHHRALRLAHALRKRWWRLRKPALVGCRVIALDGADRVLLIRHSYGAGYWMAPGGGFKRRETPVEAAVRELREEADCRLADPHAIDVVEMDTFGAINRVHVIGGRAEGAVRPDGREVIEAAFFALDDLPEPIQPALRARLPEWVTAAKAGRPLR